MSFDQKLKESARANDAVDRLRELRERQEIEQASRERTHDLLVRFWLLVVIALIVAYAIVQL